MTQGELSGAARAPSRRARLHRRSRAGCWTRPSSPAASSCDRREGSCVRVAGFRQACCISLGVPLPPSSDQNTRIVRRDALEVCGGLWGDERSSCFAVFGLDDELSIAHFDTVYALEQSLELDTGERAQGPVWCAGGADVREATACTARRHPARCQTIARSQRRGRCTLRPVQTLRRRHATTARSAADQTPPV